jgi:hypothetical protein
MKNKAMTSIQVKRTLSCILNDTEKRERGKSLADLEFAKAEIEYAKKLAMERFKDQLTATQLAIDDMVRVVRDGAEDRELECYWRYDYASMMKTLTREDTGEIVETAIIQPEERQMNINGLSAGYDGT